MNIDDSTQSDDWEAYLGEQFRKLRIRAEFDQQQLAERAGISVGALKNLESGKGSSLKTLVKVCRALGRTDWLQALAPRIAVSPLQMLRASKGRERQRVYRARKITGE